MAHNLNFKDGKASFYSLKEPAWHGLGIVVKEAKTSEEVIKIANLDYVVEKRKLYTEHIKADNSVGTIEVPNHFATVRTDEQVALGVVKNKYKIIQNSRAFDFFDNIVKQGLLEFQTAGALGKGEQIFISAKLPQNIDIRGDKIEEYILLINAHDGTSSLTTFLTPIRVVCNNTLNMALSNKKTHVMKIRHSSSYENNLKYAEKLYSDILSKYIDAQVLYNMLAETPCSNDKYIEYLCDVMLDRDELEITKKNDYDFTKISLEHISTRKRNILDSIMNYNNSNHQQTLATKNTMFGAYNSIVGYMQNVKDFTNPNSRFNSLILGSSYTLGARAFDRALQIVNS